MKLLQVLALFVIALAATNTTKADFKIAMGGKVVECSGPDNMGLTVNAKRTTVKLAIAGESKGPAKIKKISSNDKSFVRYVTKEGTLILGNAGNSFTFAGDSSGESFALECSSK